MQNIPRGDEKRLQIKFAILGKVDQTFRLYRFSLQ